MLLLLLEPNRNRQAWTVLLPVVLVSALLSVLRLGISPYAPYFIARFLQQTFPTVPFGYVDVAMPSPVPIVLGFAALWLLSYRLTPGGRVRAFFAAAGITTTMCVVSAICYSGLSISPETIACMIVCVITALGLLLAMAAARFSCRRHYNPPRFMLWLLLCVVLLFTFLTTPFAVIGFMVEDLWTLSAVPVLGAAIGLGTYALVLPFMILAFRNRLYRERFESIFRLATATRGPASDAGEAE